MAVVEPSGAECSNKLKFGQVGPEFVGGEQMVTITLEGKMKSARQTEPVRGQVDQCGLLGNHSGCYLQLRNYFLCGVVPL
jgi:hypothetical protein